MKASDLSSTSRCDQLARGSWKRSEYYSRSLLSDVVAVVSPCSVAYQASALNSYQLSVVVAYQGEGHEGCCFCLGEVALLTEVEGPFLTCDKRD